MTKVRTSSRKRRSWWQLALGLLLVAAGLYLLILARPELVQRPSAAEPAEAEQRVMTMADNSIYIPKIDRLFDYQTGDASVLNDGGWHRFPDRGGPAQGNFIIAAHRYQLGLTPWQITEQSPLYYIDRLEQGDEIVIKADGQLYEYEVERLYSVEPDAIEIEEPTDQHRLTLYSCTEQGAADGRVVVEASLVNTTN